MHNVVFKYRPIHWFPYRKIIKTTHPEDWNELTPVQFEGVVNFLNNKKKTDKDFVLLANLLLSLDVPLTTFPPEIIELQKFLNSDKPFSCWIIKTKRTEHELLTLNGPMDAFRNVTIGQFAFADTFFIQHIREKDEATLDKLIATLYLTIKEFNPDSIDERIKLVSKFQFKTKTAILFNYMVMRMWIMRKYPSVFPKPPESDEGQKKEVKPHSTWREFIRNLVNGDYVNEEKILNTLMHTVLYDYNANIKNQKLRK